MAVHPNLPTTEVFVFSGTAIETYTEALKEDEQVEWATIYRNRASAWVASRELDKAISDLTLSIENDPTYVDSYLDRGYSYALQKKSDEAISAIPPY